jgi:uncharacterized membrane protein
MHIARRTLVTVALVALGLWMGGMVALGAIAAPVVFGMVPAPMNADAMTVVFRRFDKLAVACVVVALAVEVGLALLRDRKLTRLDMTRAGLVTLATGAALYVATFVSPRIEALHRAGAVRHLGASGEELDAIHRVAERAGKLELAVAIAVIALHVIALGRVQKRN